MNILPQNGRIAIIDDQLLQAAPLIKAFSKKQMPHTYFSGDLEFLPDLNDDGNDIRILFLDINLIDNSEHDNKVLKAKLIPVLNRVISRKNYPYVLVYWSRHQHHKHLIEEEIFKNDLKDKRPIAFLSANKSDFFDLEGNHTEHFDEKLKTLFENIEKLFDNYYSYRLLLNWENIVHKAADFTLQEIFADYHYDDTWNVNSNYIISRLGKAYLGNYYKDSSAEEKLRASLISFNSIFKDSIDKFTFKNIIKDIPDLIDSPESTDLEMMAKLNERLNLSTDITDLNTPGNIIFYDEDSPFGNLLNKILSFFKLKMKFQRENSEMEEKILKKECKTEFDKIKTEAKKTWKKIGILVTPVCDFAQKNNHIYNRIVKGLLIEKKYQEYLDNNTEALFVLPFSIFLDGVEYMMVFDFRFFTTESLPPLIDIGQVKFRARQELLSEIQSKLARHINRQGLFFLD